jgi:hypothetical protein
MPTCATTYNYFIDVLNAIICYLGYNAIYLFSVCQIFYKKMKTYANSPRLDYIKSKIWVLNVCSPCKQTKEAPKYFIECFDKKSNQMSKTEMHYNPDNYAQEKDLIEECNGRLLLNDTSYIIYNAPTTNGAYDKMIISDNTFKNVTWADNKIIYKCTKYEFMSVQLKFINDPEDAVYNIALKSGERNFYIEGNALNRDFIMYYCNHILKIGERIKVLMSTAEQKTNELSYALTIVDADVNVLNVSDGQIIVFGEFAYTCV